MDDPSKVEFSIDGVSVQITVAQFRDGCKVGEIPFNPAKLFYPFDLAALCEQAVKQVAEQWAQANGG